MTITSSLTRLLIPLSSLLITSTLGAAILQSRESSGFDSRSSNLALPASASNSTLNITNVSLDPIALNTSNNFPIYCPGSAEWQPKQSKFLEMEDCYSTMQTVFVLRNKYKTQPFFFQYLSPNTGHTRYLPLRFVSRSCALVVFPRKLAGDKYREIMLAEPAHEEGFADRDVTSFDALAYDVQGILDKCLLKGPDDDTGSGWTPAGLQGELFVGLWGAGGELDRWLMDQFDALTFNS